MKSTELVWCLLLIYSLALASLGSPANVEQTTATAPEQQASQLPTVEAAPSSQRRQAGDNNSSLVNSDEENCTQDAADDEPMASAMSSVSGVQPSASARDQMATSPAMTSVHHQVWTSSSSGSLDELSPEIISKLGGDVPFLAAYALRPRLVGASSSSSPSPSPSQSQSLPSASVNQLSVNKKDGSSLQASASQRQPQQRRANLPLLAGPKLSDFSELKVETSSTSKSEHHHKRKTTLKKKQQPTAIDDFGGDSSRRRRLILAATSRLMIERRRKNGAKKSPSARSRLSSSKKLKGGKRSKSKSGRLRSEAAKLRGKLNGSNRRHHMSILRHGRQSISPALNKLPESGKTNQDDDGVKGGSRKSAMEPFYKRRKEEPVEEKSVDEPTATNDLADDNERSKKPDVEFKGTGDQEEEEDDDDQAQLEPPEPRRVGEPDVDEVEGDTVTVMPKFDGVDDDPEIPIEESEGPAIAGSGGDNNTPREREGGSSSKEPRFDEPRGKRVDRDKPDSEMGGSAGMVAGGGIGATTGGSGASGEEDAGSDGGATSADAEGGERNSRVEPGVEFADKDAGDRDIAGGQDAKEPKRNQSSAGDGHGDDDDRERGNHEAGERPFDSRRVAGGSSGGRDEANRGDGGGGDDSSGRDNKDKRRDQDEDDDSRAGDVDYRDEIDSNKSSRGDKGARRGAKESTDSDGKERKSSGGHHDKQDSGADKDKHESRKEGHGKGLDCDHDHDDDHHHHEHSHHDGIKWLQDAIPGEPGQDYPILNRVNLTKFNCRDQKYAGYYADVEARCQVFHICQADGRQDSFLCPNGTIFSQISRVCVWWNSFDCEDAPKFYALNAQLYSNSNGNNKQAATTTAHHSTPDLRPLDGARINPSDGTVNANNDDDDDDESSIDSLIKAMRRRQMMGATDDRRSLDADSMAALDEDDTLGGARGEGAMMNQPRRGGATLDREGGLSDEDEASIQRKSTKLAAADEEEQEQEGAKPGVSDGAAPSRLRHKEPRRKRRASIRQSPPKLKPRLVSGNRRRKLRHRIKPKRRA